MTAWVLGFGLLWLLHATRTRLQRAEERVRELEQQMRQLHERPSTFAAVEDQLRAQGSRLAQLERQLVSGTAAGPTTTSHGEQGPDAFLAPGALQHVPEVVQPSAAAASEASLYAVGVATPSSPTGSALAAEPSSSAPLPLPLPAIAAQSSPGSSTGVTAASAHAAEAGTPTSSTPRGTAPTQPQPRPVRAPTPPDPDPIDAWLLPALNWLRELLFGGNTVVRIGILVLLVGVVLLLGWAADHDLFPIELRLALTALGAFGLTVWGVRERQRKPGFALTLQGGSIAALYLVVCFAYRRYDLLPPALAFGLLVGLTLASGFLSVLQDSTSLIFIAQLFGFAAPILASSGRGSHVALFSYYLLLNLLVFAVAFFKAWRPLNLLGFVFTFGIATAWGALRYEPAAFPTTEPFLIGFFALYLAIPVLFALRHAGTPRGWVDGGLVFGTPLSTLGLQWKLVHDQPLAMAYSVFALAAIYLGLAFAIQRSRNTRLAALAEAYLPIGVGFATLAIPYGLNDSNLTGAAWALEGAGLYWVGVRQQRWLSRAAGVVLGLLAIAAAQRHHGHAVQPLPLLNSAFLVGALLAASSLFIAYYAYARRSELHEAEWRGLQLFIPLGLALWLQAGFGELERGVPSSLSLGAELCLLAGTAVALELLARRLQWTAARLAGFALWPTMLLYLQRYSWDLDQHPLHNAGWLGWPVVALGMWLVLRRLLEEVPQLQRFVTLSHASAIWLWALFGAQLCEQWCRHELQLDESYGASAANLTLALWAGAILRQSRTASWPGGAHRTAYLGVIAPGLLLWGAWRSAAANISLPVDPAPLPYLPILNALDLSSLVGAAVALTWLRRLPGEPSVWLARESRPQRLSVALGALLFAWWNCLLARSVHHYADVRFDAEPLFESSILQLLVSLSWTLIAFVAMLVAHRRGLRALWFAAGGLLAVVVLKLFVIDLSQLSTPAKIGSFLGVGMLLLLIGYIAPVPPRPRHQNTSQPDVPQPKPA
jgi:uncharacterized membrane protein